MDMGVRYGEKNCFCGVGLLVWQGFSGVALIESLLRRQIAVLREDAFGVLSGL